MSGFAARAAYYMARGAVRKWGPWAARKYGVRVAGGLAAGGAGALTGYMRKRKGRPQVQRPSKRTKGDIAGRPANDDTRINLNSTYNAVSLYTKRRKSGKRYTKRKPKTFSGKVKNVINKLPKTSYWTIAHTDQYTFTTLPGSSYSAQDFVGNTAIARRAFTCGLGQLANATSTATDLTHIYLKLRNYGHIESSAIVSDAARNVEFVKFWFSIKMNLDIQCFNNEFTDTNPLYADIYECTAAQNITDNNHSTPGRSWPQSLIDTNAAFSGDTIADINVKGATPQTSPTFKKYWSIDKVTRIRISSPAPFHYDMYTSGIYNAQVASDHYCMKGITKGIMIVLAPIQVTTLPAAWNFQITAVNKKFAYKCLPFAGHQPSLDMQNGMTLTTL
uniref:Capsid protein n=1 Tax=Cressdnaviricota sp. TaxID=2748378 RepID=A0A7G8LJ13_9VIRU|nr:capsid protein [Cressdnaviricota sp.]